MAAMELITFDEEGNRIGANLTDYLIPSAWETPSFELYDTVTPVPAPPARARGSASPRPSGRPRRSSARWSTRSPAPASATSRCRWPGQGGGDGGGGASHGEEADGDPRRGGAPRGGGEAFALATVVSVRRPASPGRRPWPRDRRWSAPRLGRRGLLPSLIVVRQALLTRGRAAAARPRLPAGRGGARPRRRRRGAQPLRLEGVVDVLVEPELPALPRSSVKARPATLVALAETIGWRVALEPVETADAVVVATMGHGDEDALERALDAGTGYVALVASSKRAATVLGAMRERGIPEESSRASAVRPASTSVRRARRRSPSRSSPSSWRGGTRASTSRPRSSRRSIPVCGMTVAVSEYNAVERARRDHVLLLRPGLSRPVRERPGQVSDHDVRDILDTLERWAAEGRRWRRRRSSRPSAPRRATRRGARGVGDW